MEYLTFSNDEAPVHDGVYQREFFINKKQRWHYARYCDGVWYVAFTDFIAAKCAKFHSTYQLHDKSPYSTLRWRGLAKKPQGV